MKHATLWGNTAKGPICNPSPLGDELLSSGVAQFNSTPRLTCGPEPSLPNNRLSASLVLAQTTWPALRQAMEPFVYSSSFGREGSLSSYQ